MGDPPRGRIWYQDPKLMRCAEIPEDVIQSTKNHDQLMPGLFVHLYSSHLPVIEREKNKKKVNQNRNPNDLTFLGEDDIGCNFSKSLYTSELKLNLGATCYMNCMLQALYHNTRFRKGVYAWKPETLDVSSSSLNNNVVIEQLQLLFAYLQYGCRSYYDPTPFTQASGLQTSVQQDAQEFFKVLSTFLENIFAHSPIPSVQKLVQSQFVGKMAYVTECSSCKFASTREAEFYELEMHIDGIQTLEKSIENYIQREMLSGDNKYFCDPCQQKQDAERFIQLVDLPSVLNFQLMRFVYDWERDVKRKVTTNLVFPETLNMGKYVASQNEGKGEKKKQGIVTANPKDQQLFEYQLSYVLVHKGRSAYEGHYIAFIRDEATNQWWKFNDETVESISDLAKALAINSDSETPGTAVNIRGKGTKEDPDIIADEDETELASSNTKKGCKKATNGKDSSYSSSLKSASAYMLGYIRKGTVVEDPTPPAFILNQVKAQNSLFQETVDQQRAIIAKCEELRSQRTSEYEQLEKVGLNAEADDEDLPLVLPPHSASTRKSNTTSSKESTRKYDDAPNTELTEGDVVKRTADIVKDCCWIPTNWYSNWLSGSFGGYEHVTNDSSNENTNIQCNHGFLDPLKTDQAKRISPQAFKLLQQFTGIGPELNKESICIQCALDLLEYARSKIDQDLTKKEVFESMKRKAPGDSKTNEVEPTFWISRAWLDTWSKKMSKTQDLDPLINTALKCEHGKLSTETKLRKRIGMTQWIKIKSLYPNAIEFPSHLNSSQFSTYTFGNSARGSKCGKKTASQTSQTHKSSSSSKPSSQVSNNNSQTESNRSNSQASSSTPSKQRNNLPRKKMEDEHIVIDDDMDIDRKLDYMNEKSESENEAEMDISKPVNKKPQEESKLNSDENEFVQMEADSAAADEFAFPPKGSLDRSFKNALDTISKVAVREDADLIKREEARFGKAFSSVEEAELKDICPICMKRERDADSQWEDYYAQKQAEKKQLRGFYNLVPPDIHSRQKHDYCSIPKNNQGFLLSLKWAIEWKLYMNNDEIVYTMRPVDNGPLLCKHGLLHYEPTSLLEDKDHNDKFMVVDEKLWNSLVKLYGGGPPVKITRSIAGWRFSKSICDECMEQFSAELLEKHESFCNADIQLEFEDMRTKKTRRRAIPQETKSRRGKKTSVPGVSHFDTMADFKLKVFQRFDIPPAEQLVVFNGKPLSTDGDTLTLKELGLKSDRPWTIRQVDVEDKIYRAEEKNAGFAASLLMGGGAKKTVPTSSSPSYAAVSKETPKEDETHTNKNDESPAASAANMMDIDSFEAHEESDDMEVIDENEPSKTNGNSNTDHANDTSLIESDMSQDYPDHTDRYHNKENGTHNPGVVADDDEDEVEESHSSVPPSQSHSSRGSSNYNNNNLPPYSNNISATSSQQSPTRHLRSRKATVIVQHSDDENEYIDTGKNQERKVEHLTPITQGSMVATNSRANTSASDSHHIPLSTRLQLNPNTDNPNPIIKPNTIKQNQGEPEQKEELGNSMEIAGWNCSACTFINHGLVPNCEMCGTSSKQSSDDVKHSVSQDSATSVVVEIEEEQSTSSRRKRKQPSKSQQQQEEDYEPAPKRHKKL